MNGVGWLSVGGGRPPSERGSRASENMHDDWAGAGGRVSDRVSEWSRESSVARRLTDRSCLRFRAWLVAAAFWLLSSIISKARCRPLLDLD